MRTANWTFLVCCGALATSCVYSGFDKVEGTSTGAGGTAATGGSTNANQTPSGGGIAAVSGTVGGTKSTGGSAIAGGAPPTGGARTGGAATGGSVVATGGAAGSGCTGSFETVQSSTGLCVAKMVAITAPSSANDYSIDATEVTKGQYDQWLGTSPASPASTDANCGYVTTYAEQASGGALYTGVDADHHPVADVDWCDAYMYCKGVGKRLCGAIGGGTNAYASYDAATLSQWYRACSSGGANTYPYGNTYQATYCDHGTAKTEAVGSLANCVTSTSGYAGAYDLSGNVWEWEDSCSGTGQAASCVIRGGAFYGSGNLACGVVSSYPRNVVVNGIGFRCCSP